MKEGRESRRKGDKGEVRTGEKKKRMRWDSNGEKKRKRKIQRREGEKMGLEEDWKEKRKARAMREGKEDKNEFLFHPEKNNPPKLYR